MNLAQSLAGQNPRLAEQWHPTRNGALTAADVLPGSHRRVWWLCPECGHDWQARILARQHGSGCPACYHRRRTLWPSPPAGTSLADVFPEVAAEWDFDTNGDVVPGQVYPRSTWPVWWRCAVCGHRYEARIGARTQGKRCASCRTRPSATGPMPPADLHRPPTAKCVPSHAGLDG